MNNELIERIKTGIKNVSGWTPLSKHKRQLLHDCKSEIQRLTKALEASPVGEPVAWMFNALKDGEVITQYAEYVPNLFAKHAKPLYTAPPSIDALIAEIDNITAHFDCPDEQQYENRIVYLDDLNRILNKYRSKK